MPVVCHHEHEGNPAHWYTSQSLSEATTGGVPQKNYC